MEVENVFDAGTNELMQTWGEANEKGWITLTGIDPNVLSSLSQNDEDKLVLFISGMGDVAAWARGDFALYVREKIRWIANQENWPHARYNEVWGQEVDRLSRKFGVAPKTLLNNIATCSVWPAEHRVAGQYVRYKHHEALPSGLSLEDRVSMLKTAEENGWTWARLYALAHGRILPDGSPAQAAPPPVNHIPENVDEHINKLKPQEVDEIDNYKDETSNDLLWEYNEDFPEDEDNDVRSIGAYMLDDQSIRIAPSGENDSSAPSMSKGVSITLVDKSTVNLLTQDSTDESILLHVSFGDGVAYTIRPDLKTRTIVVSRNDR